MARKKQSDFVKWLKENWGYILILTAVLILTAFIFWWVLK